MLHSFILQQILNVITYCFSFLMAVSSEQKGTTGAEKIAGGIGFIPDLRGAQIGIRRSITGIKNGIIFWRNLDIKRLSPDRDRPQKRRK